MSNEGNKKGEGVIKFLNGKMFYAVVAVCIVAAGAAIWSGIAALKSARGLVTDNSSSSTASETESVGTVTAELPTESRPEKTTGKKEETESSEPKEKEAVSPAAEFFIEPVLGKVIKDYSAEVLQPSLTYGDMRIHLGVDIAAEKGTAVLASGEGTVTAVYTDPLLGNVVEIDHGNGITAKYCGLNAKPSVNKGDTVSSTTKLGCIDSIPSECVEQAHLHLEFFKDGKPVSPYEMITK